MQQCLEHQHLQEQDARGVGLVEFFPLDVTVEADAWKLQQHLLREQGIEAPDLLINNAGICLKCEDQCDKIYQESLEVNAWGPIRLGELFLPAMLKRR